MTTWNWTLLRAGEFYLDAGAMFGIIPKPVWSKWATPDDRNRLPLQQNCLLLESEGRRVLIETGIGDKLSPKLQDIYALEDRHAYGALAEEGISGEDIDAVILTHLHFDHAGGITRLDPQNPDADKPVLTFPQAEIIVQRREWEDAIANKSNMHATYLPNHLTPEVAERTTLVEGEDEVLPGITVIPSPGHTWGQQAVRFNDPDGNTVVFVPDVMPTRFHCAPSVCMAYDVESFTSQQHRIQLMRDAADNDWTLVLNHEHAHPIFKIRHNTENPAKPFVEEFHPNVKVQGVPQTA